MTVIYIISVRRRKKGSELIYLMIRKLRKNHFPSSLSKD
ncbi:hypothetical protein BCH308197_2905 [Bacillus cereus H3081.97]|nr:hypothetical protein BCH308197_2905 [Bacillus cereus H3081.97]